MRAVVRYLMWSRIKEVSVRPVLFMLLALSVDAFACDVIISNTDSLSATIAAASTGDEICLNGGTYTELLSVQDTTKFGTSTAGLTIRRNPATTGLVTIAAPTGHQSAYLGPWNGSGVNVTLINLVIAKAERRAVLVSHNSDVVLSRVTFDGYSTDQPGGGVYVINSDLHVYRSTFTDIDSSTHGGGIWARNTDLIVTESTFTNVDGNNGAAIWMDTGGSLSVTGSTFADSDGNYGGAIYVDDVALTVTDTVFQDNTAINSGAAVYVSGTADTTAQRNTFCANGTTGNDKNGGGVFLTGSNSNNVWTNNVFVDNYTANDSNSDGGGMSIYGGRDADVHNNTFVSNFTGDDGTAIEFRDSGTTVDFRNNLVVDNDGNNSVFSCCSASSTLDFNGWYDNANEPTKGSGAVNGDPLFVAWSDDGDCTNDDFRLGTGSPMINTGDSNSAYNDPDGSRSDIGAFGGPDAGVTLTDADGDGYYAETDDCDDTDEDVNPGETEVCNGIDDDCINGADGSDASDAVVHYEDDDEDSYGLAASTAMYCPGTAPAKWSTVSGDCDDGDVTVNPAAIESCNGKDDDCVNGSDGPDAVDADTWYEDTDGDNFGVVSSSQLACNDPGVSWVPVSGDCDDTLSAVNPDATEVCNGDDDDCNGTTDGPLSSDAVNWYLDSDSDSYGDPGVTQKECPADGPTGYVMNSQDCADDDATLNPDTEWFRDADSDSFGLASDSLTQCDFPGGYVRNDQDCNDSDSSLNPDTVWYADTDNDGHGDPTNTLVQCEEPAGYLSTSTDCNDSDPTVPSAIAWFVDSDGDGYGNPGAPAPDCTAGAPYVSNTLDCNDSTSAISPDASEICGDGIDNDCDGSGGPNTDDDGDTLTWAVETAVGADDCDTDSDDDGVVDIREYGSNGRNTDGDSLANIVDPDDDNDGIPTIDEDVDGDGTAHSFPRSLDDSDGDNLYNYLDADDDGDGVLTITEGTTDLDLDNVPNYLDTDDDGDEIPTANEITWGADPYNSDSDGDGVSDGVEWNDHDYDGSPDDPTGAPQDFDLDGIRDFLDLDDDDDGIPTLEEGDTDIDGVNPPQCSIPLTGQTFDCTPVGDGVPNYHDDDSDGDFLLDFQEYGLDLDDDGTPDYIDCINCDGCDGDLDDDGISNCDENDLGTNPNVADTDGDGIDDGDEVGSVSNPTDSDLDSVIDALDIDDDGDGVDTIDEDVGQDGDPRNDDTDGDGTPDYLDTDDDGDGVDTWDEDTSGNTRPIDDDTDGDGTPNYLDTDDDGDGIPTLDEGDVDGDCDGIPAYLDDAHFDGPCADEDFDGLTRSEEEALGTDPLNSDTDGDGWTDSYEVGDDLANAPDTDEDGVIDALDDDDDGDGVPTELEGSVDPDDDGISSHLDPDSDGDGIGDGEEWGTEATPLDSDCDSAPDWLDVVDDGLCAPRDTGEMFSSISGDTAVSSGGCSSAGAGLAGFGWLIGLVMLRRRRA